MSHNYDRNESGCGKKWSEWSITAKVASIVAGIIFVPLFLILFPFVTMQLWNWLMPVLFKLPAIGFWQAVGLLLLSQILFKGCHFGRSGGSSWKKRKTRNALAAEGSAQNAAHNVAPSAV